MYTTYTSSAGLLHYTVATRNPGLEIVVRVWNP